jgi:dihydropteroate synthase
MDNHRSININGSLFGLATPLVMGILNVTPDSFYSESRKQNEEEIEKRIIQIVQEGASIIDIGAYSSRPNAADVSAEEEMARLRKGLSVIRRVAPNAAVSVDTFRSDIALMCVEEYGVSIVNDISGGDMDKNMFSTIARLKVPYVLTHIKGTPQTMQNEAHYENMLKEIMYYFSKKTQQLKELGVNDIIIDPGFGFAKTLDNNYELMEHLEDFSVFEHPVLVGISRKSMIFKLLGITPENSLNGTTALNMVALMKGADILRVHDVRQAVETIKIFEKMSTFNNDSNI